MNGVPIPFDLEGFQRAVLAEDSPRSDLQEGRRVAYHVALSTELLVFSGPHYCRDRNEILAQAIVLEQEKIAPFAALYGLKASYVARIIRRVCQDKNPALFETLRREYGTIRLALLRQHAAAWGFALEPDAPFEMPAFLEYAL